MADEKKKPKYDLDKIVSDLDPDKINDQVELKHREARAKHAVKNVKVDDYNAFLKEVTTYLKHHHKSVYKAELPEHMASGRVREILDQIYRKEGGMVGAFREAKKGNMAKVLDNLAEAMETEERGNYVQHVMNQIDPQDFDGHVDLVKQYVGKYGSLLPKGFKSKSAEQLAHEYEGLIKQHIGIVEAAKSSLKKYEPGGKKEEKKK